MAGLVVASLASRRAVTHALRAADASQMSSGFIGMTVLAIGTDLPEIANSIISAATGHGDLNVGDSAGSAVTQVTLVLGILCFSTRLTADRRSVAILGTLTAVALGAIGLLIRDGSFDRLDGTVLLLAWLVVVIAMRSLSDEQPVETAQPDQLGRQVARTCSGWSSWPSPRRSSFRASWRSPSRSVCQRSSPDRSSSPSAPHSRN